MRVRAFLALFIRANGTSVLNHGGVFAEFAVGEDREDGDVAGTVVGDEQILATPVEGEIARVFAESGELIRLGELCGLSINSERGDGAPFSGFVGGVGEFAIGMDGDPGRIGRFRSEAFWRQRAGRGIEIEGINALARSFVRIRADKSQVVLIRRMFVCVTSEDKSSKCGRKEQKCEEAEADFHEKPV